MDSLVLRYAGTEGGENVGERDEESMRKGVSAQGHMVGGNVAVGMSHRRTASDGDAMRLRSEHSMEWLEGLRS